VAAARLQRHIMEASVPSESPKLVIGVLELQGDFFEHERLLEKCGVSTKGIRQRRHLLDENGKILVDGLVIPGGESTTIGKLLVELDMLDVIRTAVAPPHCLPVLGTCAGCILLARRIRTFDDQPRIGCLEVEVERNAYGPQIESFECQVQNVQVFGEEPLRAVLIRAPVITRVLDSARVQVLASFRGTPIVVQQDHILACTFHPELTGDTRIHRRFIEIVKQNIAVERRLN
jgi:5'-phosphate synthase pdxT subunit